MFMLCHNNVCSVLSIIIWFCLVVFIQVLQNRYNGRVDFERKWTEYVKGFGDPYGEYWLGK